MNAQLFRARILIVIVINTLVLTAAFALAFALRFDFDVPPAAMAVAMRTVPWLLLTKLTAFAYFGLYRGWWRYVTLRDVVKIVKANVFGSVAFVLVVVFVTGPEGFPRSVFLIESLLSISAIAGLRALVRLFRERARHEGVQRVN